MKKLMSLFAVLMLSVSLCLACDCNIPSGFTTRQEVRVFSSVDNGLGEGMVYQATNACDSYGICYGCHWFYVSKSDKEGYKYMFWIDGRPHYFNM